MFNINQILEQAVEKEASDVHLILESKPMCRVGNVLVKMEGAPVLKETKKNSSAFFAEELFVILGYGVSSAVCLIPCRSVPPSLQARRTGRRRWASSRR